jgi:hypothetical protein
VSEATLACSVRAVAVARIGGKPIMRCRPELPYDLDVIFFNVSHHRGYEVIETYSSRGTSEEAQ